MFHVFISFHITFFKALIGVWGGYCTIFYHLFFSFNLWLISMQLFSSLWLLKFNVIAIHIISECLIIPCNLWWSCKMDQVQLEPSYIYAFYPWVALLRYMTWIYLHSYDGMRVYCLPAYVIWWDRLQNFNSEDNVLGQLQWKIWENQVILIDTFMYINLGKSVSFERICRKFISWYCLLYIELLMTSVLFLLLFSASSLRIWLSVSNLV